jgi:hypothetical protein
VGAFWVGSRLELWCLVFFFLVDVADDLGDAAGTEALDCCGLSAGAAGDGDAFSESEHVNANSASASNARMERFFIVLRFASRMWLGSR